MSPIPNRSHMPFRLFLVDPDFQRHVGAGKSKQELLAIALRQNQTCKNKSPTDSDQIGELGVEDVG